jgi:hypothetical protein
MGWYGTYNSSDNLDQGVILFSFPLPELETIQNPVDGSETEIKFKPYDVIVLTQTCDLAQKKVDRVYVCPIYTLDDYYSANPEYAVSRKSVLSEYEKLKQGQHVNKFLLNICDSPHGRHLKDKFLVVFFDKSVVLSLDYVEEFLRNSRRKNFLALKAPYRESLGQHYGRYFMRVGNPIDYPRKEDFDPASFIKPA